MSQKQLVVMVVVVVRDWQLHPQTNENKVILFCNQNVSFEEYDYTHLPLSPLFCNPIHHYPALCTFASIVPEVCRGY